MDNDMLIKNDLKTVIEGTRASNKLPNGVNWNFYNSYPKFKKAVSLRQNHVLKLISALLKNQKIAGNIRDKDDDHQFELIEEGNDTILDRVTHNIDTLNGSFKNVDVSVVPKAFISESTDNTQAANKKRILVHGRNIERPQIKFKIKVDNRPVPFKPLLTSKPNSKVPLDLCLETNDDGIMFYKHPYQLELDEFKVPVEHLNVSKAVYPATLEDTKFVEVYTEEQLNLMISDLENVNELAIDLEAHSYRTYQGFTCLMQISTRNADYIIDTLHLREKLHVLNEIFTNPAVVKVFHGADSDIPWLQRDLGLYIVNMFDTYQAAKILNFSRKGLDFLLKHYCNVDADKAFQLYDWRTRPLSPEAIYYARCDTHYLLYVYDMIKKDLMAMSTNQCNYIELVFQRSADVCKTRYEVNILSDDSHLSMYKRSKKMFDIQQMYALKHIYAWRDKLARELDESPGYILPNHMLLKISEMLPKESYGILACCSPIPPLVRQCLHEIHYIIKKAREQTFENQAEKLNEDKSFTQDVVKHIDVDMISLHDYSKSKENVEEVLPTLLNDINKLVEDDIEIVYFTPPQISIFQEVNKKSRKHIGLTNIVYKQPYELYLKTIKYNNFKKSLEVKDKISDDNNKPLNTTIPMECPDKLHLTPQVQEIKKEITDLTSVNKNIQSTIMKEIKTDNQSSSTSSASQNLTNNSRQNTNFKPHKYENTDFTKFHNQSKDVMLIAKRLQKVNMKCIN
ncbi:exosome component 10 isoform X1 [Melanaphis sacchari]|uniref:exosome component 10 isoform X1 n=1 Tax=Melanaphis sacchari TaxID=742174 RepID=UPI000DC1333E|nr:exosome component 10 isoform X1 [Melanaphis sacchari]